MSCFIIIYKYCIDLIPEYDKNNLVMNCFYGQNEGDAKKTTQLTINELHPKHPLQNQWQLWYFRPEKNKNWEDNLLDVTNFDTVEDFWAYVSCILQY